MKSVWHLPLLRGIRIAQREKQHAKKQRARQPRIDERFRPTYRIKQAPSIEVMTWNAAGKKILRRNRELFKVFRALKNISSAELAERARSEIDLGFAKIKLVAQANTRFGSGQIFKVTLSNGNEFAFKWATDKPRLTDQDIFTSHKTKLLGKKSVNCYVQLRLHHPDKTLTNYIVLMEYLKLPTADNYYEKLTKAQKEKFTTAFTNETRHLRQNNLVDTHGENCFVRELPSGKIEFVFFDLGDFDLGGYD